MRKVLLFLALFSVAAAWYHRGIIASGYVGLAAQSDWLTGEPTGIARLPRAVPRSALAVRTPLNSDLAASSSVRPIAEMAGPSSANRSSSSVGTFSIARVSQESAAHQVESIFSYLNSLTPSELIQRAEKRGGGVVEDTKQDVEDMGTRLGVNPQFYQMLVQFRAKSVLVEQLLEESNAPYGIRLSAAWEIARQFQDLLKQSLTEEQFQQMLGVAKWQFRTPIHPYQDTDGTYWSQSEAFGELRIPQDIQSEQDLFSLVSPEKIQRILDLQRNHQRIRAELVAQHREGFLTDEQFPIHVQLSTDTLYRQLKSFLSPAEAKAVGYTALYDVEGATDK